MRMFAVKPMVSILCLLTLGASPVLAQSKNANPQIEVQADSFVADLNSKSGT